MTTEKKTLPQIMLTGDKALLLAEGAKLNKEKKAAEKRLAEIKIEMKLKEEGVYKNKAGDELTLVFSDAYSEIDPEKLFNLFVKNRKKRKFWSVVKVHLGALGKIVPASSIAAMRTKLDKPITKWTFR
jgi:hypothetical protein